ncbi:MAG: flagellar biosynthesis protein FlhF [Tepidisphaerales bacterium]
MRTFSASTMVEALNKVKAELGSDAIIMHTRTYTRRRWLGLRSQEIVEVTAGNGVKAYRPRASAPAPRPAARPVTNPPADTASAARTLLQTPAASSAFMLGLQSEVVTLKTAVMELVRETRAAKTPNVPEELFDHYLQLIRSQVEQQLAADLIRDLRSTLRPEHLKNESFVRDRLAERIEKLLPTTGPIVRTKTVGPHVAALIGPTGVGKTTTIAKLAATLKLREGRRVGLVTIDTYRIAAVDQLKKYADILGSPLRVVSSPDDMVAAIQSMNDCEFVLIDTAGRSPSDTLKLNELRGFLTAARTDEVHLVLSSTASQECIERAIERFSQVRVDKIIFTKLDEAVHVGVVFNVIRKVNKALSYITTGQDVPDHIEVGHGRSLAQLIIGPAAQREAK